MGATIQSKPRRLPPHLLQLGKLRSEALLLGGRGDLLLAQGGVHLAQLARGNHDVLLPGGGEGRGRGGKAGAGQGRVVGQGSRLEKGG
jgi:hypothetical protein